MTNTEKVNHLTDKYKGKFEGSIHDTLWQIIVNEARKVDLKSCFVSTYPGKVEVGIADLDQAGHTPIKSMVFKKPISINERYRIIEELNKDVFELDPKQADIIIASTMVERATKIEIENILKIVDIGVHQVSDETVDHLEQNFADWRDQILKEHIVNIESAVESIEENSDSAMELHESQINEIKALAELAKANDAGYIRFVEV